MAPRSCHGGLRSEGALVSSSIGVPLCHHAGCSQGYGQVYHTILTATRALVDKKWFMSKIDKTKDRFQ